MDNDKKQLGSQARVTKLVARQLAVPERSELVEYTRSYLQTDQFGA